MGTSKNGRGSEEKVIEINMNGHVHIQRQLFRHCLVCHEYGEEDSERLTFSFFLSRFY